jgi:hypothetical protein
LCTEEEVDKIIKIKKYILTLKDLENNEKCSIEVEIGFLNNNDVPLCELLEEIWEGSDCECNCT